MARHNLDASKFQEICDLVAEKVPCCISVITERGVIASSQQDRVGLPHKGAQRILSGELDVLDITAKDAGSSENLLESRLLPLEADGMRIACIGISATLEKARDFASIAQACMQSMLDVQVLVAAQEISRYMEGAEELRQTQVDLEFRVRERTLDLEKQVRERELAEAQLRESELRFRQIAEVASDWFWETDSEHRFTYISKRFYELAGIDPKILIGRRRKDFIGAERIAKNPEMWGKHFEDLDAHREFSQFEYELARNDGTPFIIQLSGKPVFDHQEEFQGYRGAGRDVTQLRLQDAELRKSEARFRDIAETASDWFWEMGPDLRFSYLSSLGFMGFDVDSKTKSVLGKTREEAVVDVGVDTNTGHWAKHFEDLADRKVFTNFEYVVHDKEGDPHWIMISGKPFFDDNNVFLGYRGTARDTTELRLQEKRLHESQARLNDFVETASDWVWEMGPDLRFTYFSDRIRDILGVEPSYTLGKTRQEMGISDGDADVWEKHLEDLENHRPFRDFRYRSKNPDKEERYLKISGKPFFDSQGEFLGYRGTGSNITEEVEQKRALEANERRFRSLVENSNLGIWVHHDFNLLFANSSLAQMLGYESVEEVLALGQVNELLAPDEIGRLADYQKERIAGRYAPASYEFRAKKKDGSFIWASNHSFIIDWESQECICTTIFDITAQKMAAETLKKAKDAADAANQAKSDFLARMSHELRTPLNSIIGLSEMLLEEAEEQNDENDFEPLHRIKRSGDHLLSLINDILDISKIEAGRMELYLEEFNVRALMDQVKSTTQSLAEKGGNELIFSCDPQLKTMYADAVRVRQLLLNLLSNACKFTENGQIKLDARREEAIGGPVVVFAVLDTGIGIAKNKIANLFDDFSQADASTTRKYGGSGLGLAICRRLCDLMGGRITVASELGSGTQFTAYLPEQTELLDKEVQTGAQREQGEPQLGPGILVVDGDHAAQQAIAKSLNGEGCVVFFAKTGAEGLRMIRKIRPLVVILDLLLPDMDGFDFLAEVDARKFSEETSVIVVTKQALTQEERQALNGQTEGLFRKGEASVFGEEGRLRHRVNEIVKLAGRSS